MKSDWESQWESFTIDELFALHELMQDVLSKKLKAKKAELERRLQILDQPRTVSTRLSPAIDPPS